MSDSQKSERTFWNGEPCEARKVALVVADLPEFEHYWAASLVGQRRDAVEVTYNGEVFYLDDGEWSGDEEWIERLREVLGDQAAFGVEVRMAGSGWAKVTVGHGLPAFGHGNLCPVEGSVEPR